MLLLSLFIILIQLKPEQFESVDLIFLTGLWVVLLIVHLFIYFQAMSVLLFVRAKLHQISFQK